MSAGDKVFPIFWWFSVSLNVKKVISVFIWFQVDAELIVIISFITDRQIYTSLYVYKLSKYWKYLRLQYSKLTNMEN